jgi:hypothetical protein
MILKIYTGHGWYYMDDVKSVSIKKDMTNVKDFPYDDCFLTNHDTDANQNIVPKALHVAVNSDPDVSLVGAQSRDDTWRWIIADMAIFLMNDEGRTIERIN